MAGYWPRSFSRVYGIYMPKKENLANIQPYYMASSTSGQDESNPAL